MSTGSTHSFLSSDSTRVSAVIGSDTDQHVDPGDARELDQLGNVAEVDSRPRPAVNGGQVAVVEYAADDVVVRLHLDGADQCLGDLAATDDHGAPLDAAVARPAADGARQHEAQSGSAA